MKVGKGQENNVLVVASKVPPLSHRRSMPELFCCREGGGVGRGGEAVLSPKLIVNEPPLWKPNNILTHGVRTRTTAALYMFGSTLRTLMLLQPSRQSLRETVRSMQCT